MEASVAAVPRAATRGAASISGGVGGGLALRPDTAVGGNLLACATLTLPPRVYLAVEGDLSLPTSLVRLEGDRAIYAWSASAGFGWAGRGPVSPRVGAVGGVSWRAFGQDGVLVGSGAVPFLGAHVDGGVPLTGIIRLWGWGEGLFDLRPTDLEVGSTKVRASPWSARLGIGFGLGRKSDG